MSILVSQAMAFSSWRGIRTHALDVELVYGVAGSLFFALPLVFLLTVLCLTSTATSSIFWSWPALIRPGFKLLPVVIIFLHLLSILRLIQASIPEDLRGQIALNPSLPIHLPAHYVPAHYLSTHSPTTYPSTTYPLTI
jgi:hypothetical protein